MNTTRQDLNRSRRLILRPNKEDVDNARRMALKIDDWLRKQRIHGKPIRSMTKGQSWTGKRP